MAFVLPDHLLFSLLIILLPISAVAQNNGNLTVGDSLTANDNSSSWLSSSGDFAFGFRPLNHDEDLFLLSIWFAKIPDKTIVWYANNATAPRGSKVELTADRGLVLTGPQGEQLWKSDTIVGAVASAVMSDTGNFVLEDRNFNQLWQSFENPTDTILPTQIVNKEGMLSSRQSETNFSTGRFQLRFQQDGNLVLHSINMPTNYANEDYYASGTNGDDSNTSNPGKQLVFNASGYVYILRENGERFSLTQGGIPIGSAAADFYFRVALNFDGVFTQYSHPKTSNGSWSSLWSVPDNICTASTVSSGIGVCGYNSICTLKADLRPMCECPVGYSLLDPNNRYGSCKPNFIQSCDVDKPSVGGDLYTLKELLNTDWPLSDYQLLRPSTEEMCRKSCMDDCMCAVAIFRLGNSCWLKKLPLSNGRVDDTLNGGKALIKIRKDKGNVAVGESLSATDNSSWLSPSGDFAFGFRQLNDKDLFLLSIWFARITDKTIVWYANGDKPATRGSQVKLTADRGLVLTSPQGEELWRSETLITGVVAYGVMKDTGNFVLGDNNFHQVWESFNNPTDTMLPTQIMKRGGVLSSRQSDTNFSKGRFQLSLLDTGGIGNLVLNTINLPNTFPNEPYYQSHTTGDSKTSSPVKQLVFNESGYMYILRENDEKFTLKHPTVSSGNFYYRATLNFDGVFTQYTHPKTSASNESWTPLWSIPMPDNETNKEKKSKESVSLRSVFLGCSVFVNFVLIGAICLGFFFIYQKKSKKKFQDGTVSEMNLRGFTFKELLEATDGFKEELGRGTFGIVYKGAIQMGSSTVLVAVKKLNNLFQDCEREFKTEVNVIGQTHHKNLVRLLGFCDEGLQRLVVYEFMSSGTLAGFLFGDLKPSWKQRIQIAFGIARGLLYLHEECSTQIIHCDIKPQNILLDDYYNARISDFGLAKLLMMDQSHTHTAIRGTKGYVALEWFRNMRITAKVDVYSFGVMLLEIICCRRCIDMESDHGEEKAILTDWAYDCYQGGALDALVEYDVEALDDRKKLETFVKVAIWCIQEDPSLRPTMKRVTHMLEGVVEVLVPPCPCPFNSLHFGASHAEI